MTVDMLEYFTVRHGSPERTRDFYSGIIGRRVGPRPGFDFAGCWLYLGGQPVVHLVRESHCAGGCAVQRRSNGSQEIGALDHIACRGQDLDGTHSCGYDARKWNIRGHKHAAAPRRQVGAL